MGRKTRLGQGLERIEQEEQEKNRLLAKQKRKTESWQLYKLCKEYLEENNTH